MSVTDPDHVERQRQTRLAEAALHYAAQGWPVLPLAIRGKVPKIPGGHGFQDATLDLDQIRGWWRRWPRANVGIWPGGGGMVVIDVDPDRGGLDTMLALDEAHDPEFIPITAAVVTWSDGYHLFMAHPGGTLREGADALGPGLDVKADRGYVVAAPSWVVDPVKRPGVPGNTYRWCRPDPIIAPMPGWLVEMLRPAPPERPPPRQQRPDLHHGEDRHRAYVLAAFRRQLETLEAIPEGQHSNQLNRTAYSLGQLEHLGMDREVAFEAVRHVILSIAGKPWTEKQITDQFTSGWSKGRLQPWTPA
jgi:hypothetical protein